MKYVLPASIGLLLLANVTLLLKQARIEREVRAVQEENSRLSQELAARPVISSEDFVQAQRRIQRAEMVMDAVESRLTNATAILGKLDAVARTPGLPGRSPGVTATPVRTPFATPGNGIEGMVSTTFVQRPEALVPSASHTPDGQLQQRSWGPEQVVGPPNTHQSGDISTAWAPKSSQGGEEWLHLNYEKPVDVSQINVRETFNPGAISKLAAVLPDGHELVLWEGVEPTAQAPVDMNFSVPPGVQAQSIKIYLDRTRVPGWNEIDAVELVGRDGTRQWAASATASSSYAEQSQPVPSNTLDDGALRLR